jgi:NTP pyrophosphatase (non-canonical NTP hydrolase)
MAKWSFSMINREEYAKVLEASKALGFNNYQKKAHSTAVYPPEMGMAYCVTGLCAECGEVADKVAKYYRGDGELNRDGLKKELGDVLWFIAELSTHLGFDLDEVAQGNLDKLADRQKRKALKGNGDNR